MTARRNAWADLMTASIGMVSTSVRAHEMMVASSSVIGARMAIMSHAARRPADGDYVEIGGMALEKVVAASKVNQALFNQWSAMVVEVSEQAQYLGRLALGGRALSAGEVSRLAERWTAYGTRMIARTMDAGGLALAPVHQQATANARRLG